VNKLQLRQAELGLVSTNARTSSALPCSTDSEKTRFAVCPCHHPGGWLHNCTHPISCTRELRAPHHSAVVWPSNSTSPTARQWGQPGHRSRETHCDSSVLSLAQQPAGSVLYLYIATWNHKAMKCIQRTAATPIAGQYLLRRLICTLAAAGCDWHHQLQECKVYHPRGYGQASVKRSRTGELRDRAGRVEQHLARLCWWC
jgi:hypothetical protein